MAGRRPLTHISQINGSLPQAQLVPQQQTSAVAAAGPAALATLRIHQQADSPPVCWEHVLAPRNLDGAMPDENSQASEETRKLRARFPGWGILFDPRQSVWVAVHGKKTLVAASSPETLTERVEAAARGEAGPDEGEKTQPWRARRRPGRGLPKTPGIPACPRGCRGRPGRHQRSAIAAEGGRNTGRVPAAVPAGRPRP